MIRDRKSVSVQELQGRLSASPATLRRDLAYLESERKVVRTHGGAALPEYLAGEPSFALRQQSAPEGKRLIGERASKLEGISGAVFIDAGTTCLELGKRLLEQSNVRVFTNSLPVLNIAATLSCEVVSIGGSLRRVSYALVGGVAMDWLEHLYFDWAFLGASGLCPQGGAYTTEPLEAGLKAKVLERAHRRVLLCDHGKWRRPTAVRFAGWGQFDTWVADRRPLGWSTAENSKEMPRLLTPKT